METGDSGRQSGGKSWNCLKKVEKWGWWGGGQGGHKISPQKWGSIDAIDDSFGKCSSKVIILGGVEIKMVDFGGV